jgi:hypothetical protein
LTSGEIDRFCHDWLGANCGREVASQYTAHSLVLPQCNSTELNEALGTLRLSLCVAFGPDECFGSVDYMSARQKLRLDDHLMTVPEVFAKAFATDRAQA